MAATLEAGLDGNETFAADGAPLLSEDAVDEDIISDTGDSAKDPFDVAMAELEVLMMDEGLNASVDAFTKEHCGEFEAGEENKLVYTELFNSYTQMVEEYIEKKIGASVASFDMAGFCVMLQQRAQADEALLDHPALEMLFAYSDYEAFKQLMLATKEGSAVEAESGAMCVSGEMLGLSGVGAGGGGGLLAPPPGEVLPGMEDDDDEGDAAPNLNDALTISAVKPS